LDMMVGKYGLKEMVEALRKEGKNAGDDPADT